MKLTLEGIKDKQLWSQAGIELPSYDLEELAQRTKEAPVWVHFGIGNIFRIFIGSIADRLITDGLMDRGIVCVETFDYETIDRIYKPYDNLSLSVILNNDGTTEKRVFGCFTEARKGLRDGRQTALKRDLCQSESADGFLYDHGKGICAAWCGRTVLPLYSGRY